MAVDPKCTANRYINVISLSVLRTSRLYLPINTPGAQFCYKLDQPHGHIAAGRMSMKNSNDIIGNRTRDFSAYTAVSSGSIITKRRTQRCLYSFVICRRENVYWQHTLKYIRTVLNENMLKLLLHMTVIEISWLHRASNDVEHFLFTN